MEARDSFLAKLKEFDTLKSSLKKQELYDELGRVQEIELQMLQSTTTLLIDALDSAFAYDPTLWKSV